MTINPMKALAADRVMQMHGLPPKQEPPAIRSYMSKEDALKVIEDIKARYVRRVRSKLIKE